ELYDAIENERAGRKTFTAADQMRPPDGFDLDGHDAEMASAARQIREELQTVGVRPDEMSSRAVNEAAEMLARGDERDAITAYERAVMNLDDKGPVQATYAQQEGRSLGSIFEAFKDDPGAGKRYKAATQATRERIGTYNKGYQAFALTYRVCTPSAQEASARYLREGEQLARNITGRYGG
ncbi:TIGR02301 family protein, partial [Micromonospora zhanjiangensis]